MAAATKGKRPTSKTRETVSIDTMRDKLGAYVNQASEGERIVVTRHGLRAAALVSIADLEKIEAA